MPNPVTNKAHMQNCYLANDFSIRADLLSFFCNIFHVVANFRDVGSFDEISYRFPGCEVFHYIKLQVHRTNAW